MRLLIDLDGVCADTHTPWLDRYNHDYDDYLPKEAIVEFEIHKFVKPECGMKIYDYIQEPNFFYNLKPLPDCQRVLKELSTNHEVFIVTSIPSSSVTGFNDKLRWVREHLPFVNKDNFIGAHRKDVIAGDLLFDDAVHNLLDFKGEKVLMSQPWNENSGKLANFHRVHYWESFLHLVGKLDR